MSRPDFLTRAAVSLYSSMNAFLLQRAQGSEHKPDHTSLPKHPSQFLDLSYAILSLNNVNKIASYIHWMTVHLPSYNLSSAFTFGSHRLHVKLGITSFAPAKSVIHHTTRPRSDFSLSSFQHTSDKHPSLPHQNTAMPLATMADPADPPVALEADKE